MKNFKKIILITSTIIVGTVSIVGASGFAKKIEAYMNPELKITIDGESYIAKEENGTSISPIIYEGHTYLPIKNISEIAGMNVKWDEKNKTVVLTTQTKEDQNHTFIGKYLNKVDEKHIDLLQGDIVHRINIENVGDTLNNIDVGEKIQVNTEIKDGKQYATLIKKYIVENEDIKFDTMGNRIYTKTGKFMGYTNNQYIEILQDDMMFRFTVNNFDKKFEKGDLVNVSYIQQMHNDSIKSILIDIQKAQ